MNVSYRLTIGCLGWAVREAPCCTTLLTPYDVKLAVRVYECSVREAPLPFGVYGGYLSVRGAKNGVRGCRIERLTSHTQNLVRQRNRSWLRRWRSHIRSSVELADSHIAVGVGAGAGFGVLARGSCSHRASWGTSSSSSSELLTASRYCATQYGSAILLISS